jgi:hypothetical protein
MLVHPMADPERMERGVGLIFFLLPLLPLIFFFPVLSSYFLFSSMAQNCYGVLRKLRWTTTCEAPRSHVGSAPFTSGTLLTFYNVM